MAVATGCMATVARFREYLLVEYFPFGSAHSPSDAMFKSGCRIVK